MEERGKGKKKEGERKKSWLGHDFLSSVGRCASLDGLRSCR